MFHLNPVSLGLMLAAALMELTIPGTTAAVINRTSPELIRGNSKRDNQSEGSLIHIPIQYKDQQFRLIMRLGKNSTYAPALDLGSGPTWVSTWSNGGYDRKGRNLHGIVQDLNFGYVSGPHVSGEVWQDHIQIIGRGSDGKAIELDHEIQFGINNSSDTGVTTERGLASMLGLTYTPHSGDPKGVITVFESLIKAGHLQSRELAFYCPPLSNGSTAVGQLTLGGRDPEKFVDDIATTPVTKQGGWNYMIDDIVGLGGEHLNLDPSFRSAEVDSGQNGFSTMITPAMFWHLQIPGAILAEINGQLVHGPTATWFLERYRNGSDFPNFRYSEVKKVTFALPCNLSQELVPKVVVGGKQLQMRVEDLVVHDHSYQYFYEKLCRSSLEGFSTNHWGFGQPWMRSFYTILNWGEDTQGTEVGKGATVSFANAAPYKPYVHPSQ